MMTVPSAAADAPSANARAAPEKGETPSGAESGPDPVIINEVQLILAEKRTALSVMRTGIAVFVLPLSVLSLLIATSKLYDVRNVLHLFSGVLVICLALLSLGSYLIVRSVRRMRRQEKLILAIKRKHSRVAEFLD